MQNLRILSMNLGRNFVPVIDKNKKTLVTNYLNAESYDFIMLQGNNLDSNINLSSVNYKILKKSKRLMILYKGLKVFNTGINSEVIDTSIVQYNKSLIACINVNCSKVKNFKEVEDICKSYSDFYSYNYMKSRIITGRFPKEIDLNTFCDLYDLDDVSSLLALNTHIKNNREVLNHLLISKNLEVFDIKKIIGLKEIADIGEAYPIEASLCYKKVFK